MPFRSAFRAHAPVRSLLLLVQFAATSAFAYPQPRPVDYMKLNPAAREAILYELQPRTANACNPEIGAESQKTACREKLAPPNRYEAFDGDSRRCTEWSELQKIKLGTLDDLLDDTDDYHVGITLRYIKDKVGANTIWIMPVFPNNSRWSIPDACDNLGSPYAVRDYMHVSGRLDSFCIKGGKDEYSAEETGDQACWGNAALEKVIAKAHGLGLKVMLDVALNHFGHNYLFYDYESFTPIRDRLARGDDLDRLWDFHATFEPSFLNPKLVDTTSGLTQAAKADSALGKSLGEMRKRCPKLSGDKLVRATLMWREMLDWEREQFSCESPMYLEFAAPGFYLGQKSGAEPEPSKGVGHNFTNNWVDVKFLYHHEYRASDGRRGDYYHAFVRNREYLFRVLNYWVSQGVDGFRLDHTTDPDSGMGPNEWKYLLSKVNHYDWVRKGRPSNHVPPIYLAEEFGDQMGMNHVVDAMTDGYVGDIRGGNGTIKGASHVRRALENGSRFATPEHPAGRTLVLRALETHDEHRLFENTGFNPWTGAGFWSLGVASRGMPMLLMGQEFGESWGLGFRKSAILPSRFHGHPNHRRDGEALVDLYRKLNFARQDPANRALSSSNGWVLTSKHTRVQDERIFAQARWDSTNGAPNVVFTFNNLWEGDEWAEQAYFISPELAAKLGISDHLRYKLVDVFSGQSRGSCRTGAELKWELYVKLHRSERLQWLRLEQCQ